MTDMDRKILDEIRDEQRELRQWLEQQFAGRAERAAVVRITLTIDEVAAMLGKHPSTVRRWIAENPHHWLRSCAVRGSRTEFVRYRVEEYLKLHERIGMPA